MPRLILTYKNKVVTSYIVPQQGDVIIGRDPGSQLVIEHPSVSSHHARICMRGKNMQLTDLGSTNGTYVNQEKVADCQLTHQDWICIGKHIIIVDLYETLSLDATIQMLKIGASNTISAEGTLVLDMNMYTNKKSWAPLDYLNFLEGDLPDLELSHNPISIGKNKDADIVIKGFWSLLAGQPTATIIREGECYILEYVAGPAQTQIKRQNFSGPDSAAPSRYNQCRPL